MESCGIKREKTVRITELKTFVHDRLPRGIPARDIIMTESDELPANEFIIKSLIWLKLLKEA